MSARVDVPSGVPRTTVGRNTHRNTPVCLLPGVTVLSALSVPMFRPNHDVRFGRTHAGARALRLTFTLEHRNISARAPIYQRLQCSNVCSSVVVTSEHSRLPPWLCGRLTGVMVFPGGCAALEHPSSAISHVSDCGPLGVPRALSPKGCEPLNRLILGTAGAQLRLVAC